MSDPVGRTKEAGGGGDPERRSSAFPAPSCCRSFLTSRGARGPGWNRLRPGLLWTMPRQLSLPNSFSASLEGNPLGVCCRHLPVSYPGGLKPVEFPTLQGRRELVAEAKIPPALLDPANASCMT